MTGTSPSAGGWRRIATRSLVIGGSAAVPVTLLGWLVEGQHGGVSALSGAAVVVGLSWSSLMIIDIADRRIPRHTITVFLATFTIKLGVLAMLFSAVAMPDWMIPVWVGAGAVVALLAGQTAVVLGFRRMRLTVGSPLE